MRETFGNLRVLREGKNLRQRELADYLKCTQECYSHYEVGRREIPTTVIVKLCRYYDTSADYLLGLTDIKEPYPHTGSV